MRGLKVCFCCLLAAALGTGRISAEKAPEAPEAWRVDLYSSWKSLPVPPITPYTGPFCGDARAFIGSLNSIQKTHAEVWKSYWDWKRNGTYDPAKDPRPINLEFEEAVLRDWTSMGYNTSYKGNYWTYRSGRWLKSKGLLGAIDQTLWGARGPAPFSCDGKEGPRQREACGSFFHSDNYQAGVTAVHNMAVHHGELDLVNVGNTYITCSWDEVGMRTRSMIDYRPEAIVEYRKYLKDVWFQDDKPGSDTNGDGRTYNQFTGEKLGGWGEVQPPKLSPRYHSSPTPTDEKWSRTGAFKLWLDFHRYYTFEFFRRINEDASTELDGKRIECYPFPQAFIMWPGMGVHWGMSVYWNARLNPIVNIEQCWPESPAMTLNYAMTDRLARKHKNVIMGWTWFYFGKEAKDMYNGPYDNGRALARMMGHRVDGIHHWLYSPIYRARDRHQRKQIAYWHNFLSHHYQSFLAKSEPVPAEVAVLMPDYTGYFYRMYNYPKSGWAYTAEALQEAQIPYEILCEEELELDADALKQYKALYVVGSEWTTPTIRKRVDDFIEAGGVVYANVDSLSLDIPTGKRTDYLEKTFGVKIERKHKNSFLPATQSAEEEEWAAALNGWGKATWLQGHNVHLPGVYAKIWKEENGKVVPNEEEWGKLDEALAKMPREARGIPQSPIDMRAPPKIRYAEGIGPTQETVTWSEVDTARVVEGKPIAWLVDEVCGVETENTVWLGTRPGMSLHAISPRMSMNRTTEPCNPYITKVSDSYETHRPYVELISYAARKAGVKRLVTVSAGGKVPCNLEVLPRADEDGTLMVFVINHDATEGTYQVEIESEHLAKPGLKGAEAFDLLNEKLIESNTDGKFELSVPAWKVAVFAVGTGEALKTVKEAQKKLNAKDLSVPKYFIDRPELNTGEWSTPTPAK